MTGYTDLSARAYLDMLVNDYPYLALFSAVGSDTGSGFTELSGFGYTRINTNGLWAYAAGSMPATISNSSAITLPAASGGDWATIIAWGLLNAPTSGSFGFWDYLGNFAWFPVFITNASPAIIDAKAHGYSVGDKVVYTTEYGGTVPSFSASNFTGLLTIAHAATDTFDVTNSAVQVNTSSTGSGSVRKVTPQTVTNGTTPIFPISSFVLTAA